MNTGHCYYEGSRITAGMARSALAAAAHSSAAAVTAVKLVRDDTAAAAPVYRDRFALYSRFQTLFASL